MLYVLDGREALVDHEAADLLTVGGLEATELAFEAARQHRGFGMDLRGSEAATARGHEADLEVVRVDRSHVTASLDGRLELSDVVLGEAALAGRGVAAHRVDGGRPALFRLDICELLRLGLRA